MDMTALASIIASFVVSFGGTKLAKGALGLSGSVKLRAVATLLSALGVVGTKVAASGTFDPTDVDAVVKAAVEVVGVTFAAHLMHKATKKDA
jgi:hypothetical protein